MTNKSCDKICIEKFPSRRQGHLSHSSWGRCIVLTLTTHSSAATLGSAGELFSLNCVRSLGRSNFFTHPFHAWRFTLYVHCMFIILSWVGLRASCELNEVKDIYMILRMTLVFGWYSIPRSLTAGTNALCTISLFQRSTRPSALHCRPGFSCVNCHHLSVYFLSLVSRAEPRCRCVL